MTRPTKTILICDDDQGMRDTLTAILKRDYRVISVSSGKSSATIFIGPLSPGSYPFVGEYNEKTAKGVIIVK